jgi:hypothetical protein
MRVFRRKSKAVLAPAAAQICRVTTCREPAPGYPPLMTMPSDPLAVDSRFFIALVKPDQPELDRLLADDFIIIDVMRGSEIPKSAFVEAVVSRQVTFETIRPAERRVRSYPGTAVVTGRTQMKGRFGDAPFEASSRYTHVYVLLDGEWRMVSAQGTPIAPD